MYEVTFWGFCGDSPKASWMLSGSWSFETDCLALLVAESSHSETRCGVCCTRLAQPVPWWVSAAVPLASGSCCWPLAGDAACTSGASQA